MPPLPNGSWTQINTPNADVLTIASDTNAIAGDRIKCVTQCQLICPPPFTCTRAASLTRRVGYTRKSSRRLVAMPTSYTCTAFFGISRVTTRGPWK